MECFFGCFRVKDTSLPPTAPDSNSHVVVQSKEPVVSRNRSPLSSLFISEEKREDSDLETGTPKSELDAKELRYQAKFLKACGTLPETPAEIRKGLLKCNDLSTPTGDIEPLKFNSWLSDKAIQKLNLNVLPDHPTTPCESSGLEKQSGSLARTPSSCMTDGQNGQSLSKSSINGSGTYNTPTSIEVNANQAQKGTASEASPTFAPSAQMNKSVRFDCESDLSSESSKSASSAVAGQNSKQPEFSGNYCASKSPYPTPLKLTDEMQTPGTVFPAYLDNIANGKTAWIRSQYVYPVLNPVDRGLQLKELSDEDSYSIQDSSIISSSNMTESGERPNESSFVSELGNSGLREASVDKESKFESSLSSWLKPPSINKEESKQHNDSVYGDHVRYGRTPGDRPILGLVAAHWKEDENSHVSPKWWDGNGIPNSTTKYKEDQKVSWHATPFEERLEKALSEETAIPQRKQLSGTTPITFNGTEESDTALSKAH